MIGGVDVARDASCWTLTLDRPEKLNALSADLVEQLIEGFERATSAGARVIVFRGNGKNFSAGFDFGDLESQSEGDLLLRFVRIELLLEAVAASTAVTVAIAHGRNFGAGVDLFAACRQRFCSQSATFRMPGLLFGLVLGSRRFAAIAGTATALEILERAEVITASRAATIGLATRLLEPDAWPAAIGEVRDGAATVLDTETRRLLHAALNTSSMQRDLELLVRSAARPGLKARIEAYRKSQSG